MRASRKAVASHRTPKARSFLWCGLDCAIRAYGNLRNMPPDNQGAENTPDAALLFKECGLSAVG